MKSFNAKLVLSALSVVATLTTPAFAQRLHPHRSWQHQITSDPPLQSGLGIYDVAPNYSVFPNPYNPAITGGGSAGYNQNLHDDKW